ncbi:MAG: hypothetical protein RSF73_10225 [Ruthenibacterium sp.]
MHRNLDLMRAFIHTDYTIFTENSTRQDKGTAPFAEKYAYQYLLCGYAQKDESLRAIGVLLLEDCIRNGRPFPISIDDLMRFPEAFKNLPAAANPEVFAVDRLLKGSGLLRLSRSGLNLWAVEKLPIFLFLKKGNIDFYLKGGINFFNCRHLEMQNIHACGDSYVMEYEGTGRYYQPFGEYQGTADWWEMDQSKRNLSGCTSVKIKIKITPVEDGYDINVHTDGCTGSPIRFEFGVMPHNILVRTEGCNIPANAGGSVIVKQGDVELFDGQNAVKIGPAFAKNDVIKGLFGSVPASEQRFNIFFNDETNFDRTISIRVK